MSDNELDQQDSWFWSWFRWCPTSMTALRSAEKKLLSFIKTPYRGWYVDIGPVVGKTSNKIWTISLNEESERTPILLVHGLGAGVALWSLNLDALAMKRPLYAIDTLGFGRSSRPDFSSDGLEAERQLVLAIEEWRTEMQLDRFVILGHSMGGFLATSYAIRYPERVAHLVLADPWGFPEKPTDISARYPIPIWIKAIAYMMQPLNPLWGIRIAGPFGAKLIEKARPDLVRRFSPLVKDDDVTAVPNYIFHCNAQKPSGEAAFHAMMSSFGWAKYPMINRMDALDKGIPITVIYGSRSWVDHSPGKALQQLREGAEEVNIHVINGAGHHVYADKCKEFNSLVNQACEYSDKRDGYLPKKRKISDTPNLIKSDNPCEEEIQTPSVTKEVDNKS